MSIVIIVTVVLAFVAIVATYTIRDSKPVRKQTRTRRAEPARSIVLGAKMKSVLAGPGQKYGRIFTGYQVWETQYETRLDLESGAGWIALNEFTRKLIVRYLWRALESPAGGAVVIVDAPRLEWNAAADSDFRDHGFDWRTNGAGPQFARVPALQRRICLGYSNAFIAWRACAHAATKARALASR